MSYIIYADLISILLDPKIVDPGSTVIRQKNFLEGRGQMKKQDRKIVLVSLPLLYQYHV